MRRFIVLSIILVSLFSSVHAQNMIPNPSFEDFDRCPNSLDHFYFANDWITTGLIPPRREIINGVSTPLDPSPDLFNSCRRFNRGQSTIALDILGFNSFPRTGGTYAGMVVGEYIQVKMNCPMIKGDVYHFSIWVKSAYSQAEYANNLGVYFSNDTLKQDGGNRIIMTPHIEFTDTIDNINTWKELKGKYTASGGEEFITVGHFSDQITYVPADPARSGTSNLNEIAYILMDDLSLTWSGNFNIGIGCQFSTSGKGITVNSVNNEPFDWYEWVKDTAASIDSLAFITTSNILLESPTQTTTYIATDVICHTDTFTIFILDENDNALKILPEDTSICPGTTVTLSTNYDLGLEEHIWSTGDTIQELMVDSPGVYTLEVGKESCKKTVQVTVKDSGRVINPSIDTSICRFNEVIYSFPNNDFSLSPDVSPTPEDSLTFILSPLNTTTYQLSYVDNCSEQIDTSITLTIRNCDIFIPNAFSPNGDFVNDEFHIGETEYDQIELTIYDRFGKRVYHEISFSPSWNGEFKDKKLSEGVYVYYAIFTDEKKETVRLTGNLTLVR